MSSQLLKYAGLDRNAILAQLQVKISTDSRFNTFNATSLAEMLLEMFAGTTDITNYYIQRQAEEEHFSTMQRMSSAILRSRDLGYIITRPIPAEVNISIKLQGDFSWVSEGYTLQIPIYQKISYNNFDFLFKNTFTYTFTSSDVASMQIGSSYTKTIIMDDNGDAITLIQGTIKTKIILGSTNPQIGQKFQIYRITDSTISNKIGSSDFDQPITKVWVGDSQVSGNEYVIDRRSLINNTVIQGIINSEIIKCCVIRTAVDMGVDLLFGDSKITETGADINNGSPTTTFDNIYFQYLSTQGTEANKTGVIGDALTYSNTVYINSTDVTDKISFIINSNITGGADIEDLDSIAFNSPSMYYSQDRLVDHTDYVNYLKSLISPKSIKNALAWGEQEEAESRGVQAVQELCNVILFSCLGSLYNITGLDENVDTFSPKTIGNGLDEAILDTDFNENGLSGQSYFNIYVKNNIAAQLKESLNADIEEVIGYLDERSMITDKHIYVSPIIHNFNLDGTVYIDQLYDKNDLMNKINNALYKDYDKYNDYNAKLYLSNSIDIIQDFDGIDHADVKFTPAIDNPSADLTYFIPELGSYPLLDAYAQGPNSVVVQQVIDITLSQLSTYFGSSITDLLSYQNFISSIKVTSINSIQGNASLSAVNERTFLTEFALNLYNALKDGLYQGYGDTSTFYDSDDFLLMLNDIHKDICYIIGANMFDDENNISPQYTIETNAFGVDIKTYEKGGYTLGNEIIKITSTINYTYKS